MNRQDESSTAGRADFPKLLTIKEVSGLFSVSCATIRRMIDSRIIPFYKVAGAIRLSEKEMLAYLENQRVKPKEEWFLEAPHKSHPRRQS